ncbi:MAG: hypothetical protein A3C06_02310 [Candidatus Taylorbacteria bacterium RIFCSPHIGHO2_02_FULL_46_13]|uniref:DUF4190 domain-containing protein n=1 Tax=Candidatus Taylorbacteria bacterium RIFCSPHIGHO2_02_FULL_46_13 TaxID=1802312 RepID=A0A1G2MSN1_9BACT|nr:MAG: hypothetical protein A3C06_02310 [Candidatus Taylorbacteria bacterium RIFCSPHIGHO2_02_FULL_46_13]
MPANIVQQIVNPVISLLIGIAIVVFLWGAVEFVAKADNPEGREVGKRHLVWGIIGLAIIFSVYGILNFIQGTLLCLFRSC